MTDDQVGFADVLLNGAAIECRREALALLVEGYMKVVLVRALLDGGFVIREGSHVTKKDWLLEVRAGRLEPKRDDRPDRLKKDGSRDVRAHRNGQSFCAELKTFGEFGTRDFFSRDKKAGLRGDLDRVISRQADVAVVAVSGVLYDGARGIKLDKRGRKVNTLKHVFDQLLPARSDIPEYPTIGNHSGTWGSHCFRIHATKVVAPLAGDPDRVVVAIGLDSAGAVAPAANPRES